MQSTVWNFTAEILGQKSSILTPNRTFGEKVRVDGAKTSISARSERLDADFYVTVHYAGGVQRKREIRVVEADAVVKGERLLLDRRLHRGTPTPVADDAAGHHRRTGERIDVAHRTQRPVVEAEQRRLRTIGQQHSHPAVRDQVVIAARCR